MNGTLTPARPVRVALRSGHVLAGGYRVRPASPEDAERIREFVCGLSVQTQYLRFFTAVSTPSRGLLGRLTGNDGVPSDILVIIDDTGSVVGHGMTVDALADGVACSDVGLVIADSWQGQGLGPMLLRLLADRAARRGVSALVLEVLPGNARMLALIERHWPAANRKRTSDAIVVTATLSTRSRSLGIATQVTASSSQGVICEPGRSAA